MLQERRSEDSTPLQLFPILTSLTSTLTSKHHQPQIALGGKLGDPGHDSILTGPPPASAVCAMAAEPKYGDIKGRSFCATREPAAVPRPDRKTRARIRDGMRRVVPSAGGEHVLLWTLLRIRVYLVPVQSVSPKRGADLFAVLPPSLAQRSRRGTGG